MRRHDRDVILPEVFLGRDAVRDGLFSEKQLRGPSVQRVLRGVYTVRGRPLTHVLRSRAAALLLPPGGVVTGRSQATLLGVELRRWEDEVEVLVPAPAGARWTAVQGIALRRARTVDPGAPRDGVPVATAERMAFDATTRMPLAEAVANLDALVRGGAVALPALRRWLDEVHGPHVVAARKAAELCDPRAESRQESVVRVVLHGAGLPVVPGVVVRDRSGGFVARLDLALEEFRVAVEYDGEWHALRQQLTKDRRRLAALRDAGWEVVHVTAPMLSDPQAFVDTVRRAVARQKLAYWAA
ncbi:endonuclease domain-containing protein [Kineococcus sp. LSe6-4]|uniref:Endonuclease domain-containing protein n=1 Tax=Kineococcus halophytocola TaxID=3234027 RepID=A0ABV4H2X7_9ACTN